MLKFCAIIFMTIDHIGYYFYPLLPRWLYVLCRLVGRLAFPIFAYHLALGYRRTHNFFHYGIRLFVWAIIDQLVIHYAKNLLDLNAGPNVLFTLALGLVFLIAYDVFKKANYDRLLRLQATDTPPGDPADKWQVRFNDGFAMQPQLGMALGIFFMLASLLAAAFFDTDYGAYGVLTVFLFHLALQKPEEWQVKAALLYQSLFNLLVICSSQVLHSNNFLPSNIFAWSPLQGFSVLAVLVIAAGQRFATKRTSKPPLWQKYFFYLYYPLHILILAWLAQTLLY